MDITISYIKQHQGLSTYTCPICKQLKTNAKNYHLQLKVTHNTANSHTTTTTTTPTSDTTITTDNATTANDNATTTTTNATSSNTTAAATTNRELQRHYTIPCACQYCLLTMQDQGTTPTLAPLVQQLQQYPHETSQYLTHLLASINLQTSTPSQLELHF